VLSIGELEQKDVLLIRLLNNARSSDNNSTAIAAAAHTYGSSHSDSLQQQQQQPQQPQQQQQQSTRSSYTGNSSNSGISASSVKNDRVVFVSAGAHRADKQLRIPRDTFNSMDWSAFTTLCLLELDLSPDLAVRLFVMKDGTQYEVYLVTSMHLPLQHTQNRMLLLIA
jgi:hypothetical protein